MPLSRTRCRFGCRGRSCRLCRRPRGRRRRRGHVRRGGVSLGAMLLATDGARGGWRAVARRPRRLPRCHMRSRAHHRMRRDVRWGRCAHNRVRRGCGAHDGMRRRRGPCRGRRMRRRTCGGCSFLFVRLGLRQRGGRQGGAQKQRQYHRTGLGHEFLHTVGRAQSAVRGINVASAAVPAACSWKRERT